MEISFNNVEYIYHKKTPLEKIALKNIDINFKKNKINAIIGKSGSGKTTLIEMINALIIPTNGEVIVDNLTISKDKRIYGINKLRSNIGMVFQFPEDQMFHKTVREEIMFSAKLQKIDIDDEKIIEVLKMVELGSKYLDKEIYKLSGGEARKVAIASILIAAPKVLIFDEPTVGLDSQGKNKFIKLVKSLKAFHDKTIIIISHDVDMIHKISDYIVVLNEGEIVLSGDKYEVFTKEKELKKYGIRIPKIIEFSNLVLEKKGIKLGHRDDINDLIKDVYRYVK